jgi:SEC-C motif-containing protein
MQSRFSAFAVSDAAYLLASWHSTTRPSRVDLDDDTRWTRLEILETSDGGLFDTSGMVEFRAHYSQAGARRVLHERSTFAREDGQWRYLSGVTPT